MPFLFKNKENQKWISFEGDSSTYGSRSITVRDCEECNLFTVNSDMPDSTNGEYMIKLKDTNKCIFPDSNNNLISGDCKSSSNNIYEMKKLNEKYAERSLPPELKVSITFSDNESSNINNKQNNWGKKLTVNNSVHNYHSKAIKDKTKIYNILKHPKLIMVEGGGEIKNPKIKDFLSKNIIVYCKIYHVIEEYDAYNRQVAKKTYRLKYIDSSKIGDVTNSSIAGVFMFIDSSEPDYDGERDAYIHYYGKRNYDRESMDGTNSKNFSKAYIAAMLSRELRYGYINTNQYSGGIMIKTTTDKRTSFRVTPTDTIYNAMINYSYPTQVIGDSENVTLNMSSYINPNKKFYKDVNNKIISRTYDDGTDKSKLNLAVIPTSRPTNVVEGFSDSITDKVDTLKTMLASSATSLSDVIALIDSIINSMTTSNNESEYAHTVNMYKLDLNKIKHCFSLANSLYPNIEKLHKNMTDNYKKIGLNNVYGNLGADGTMSFDDALANTVIDQLTKLRKEIVGTKSSYKSTTKFSLSLIEVEGDILIYLIDLFKYFKNYYEVINKHVNAFFDYNEAKKYIKYCETKEFLIQIKLDSTEDYNYNALINLTTGSLKERIQYGERLANKSKTFFDINFGEIYDQLFINAISGPREFQLNRIEKLLHRSDEIKSKFMGSGEGVMHYYHDLLISQKEYYQSFKDIKKQYQNIKFFIEYLPRPPTMGLPLADITSMIFEFYGRHGRKLNTNKSNKSVFFLLMEYYFKLFKESTDSARHDSLFLSLFKNLRYRRDMGQLINPNSISYEDINKYGISLYYVNNNYINKKYEPNIVREFMKKYDAIANRIQAQSEDSIISINDSELKVREQASAIGEAAISEPFSTSSLSEYHKAIPDIIAAPQGINYDKDYDTNVFNDAFLYEGKSLNEYLNDTVADGGFSKGPPALATCSDSDGPGIAMTYYCGLTQQAPYGVVNADGKTESPAFLNNFFTDTACKSSTVFFDINVTLTYQNNDENDTCTVKLVNSEGNSKIITDYEGNSFPHTRLLEKFDETNGFTELRTVYNGPEDATNNMDYLEDILNEEPSSADSVLYNVGPFKYFRLYIKEKRIKLDYKLARGIPIISGEYEGPFKGLVDPNKTISNRDKVIHLYENKKNVGAYLNKSVYIDSAGVSHNIHSDKLNTNITIQGADSTDNTIYKEYLDYCYDGILTSTVPGPDSIARFDVGSDDGGPFYLNRSEMVNVYPSSDGMCADDTTSISLKLKKNEFNSNYGACVTDPTDLNMVTIKSYNSKKGDSGSNKRFSDEKCDKKHVFVGAVDRFKTSRKNFRNKFATMIQLFNELNENELNMLEGTQESIENLKDNIKEYNKLHLLATKNEKKNVIIDAQTDDMEIQYENSQRNMAIMGIGAIGAVLVMFNYMKNS